MDLTTLAAPIIESFTGLLAIYITVRSNSSVQNFYVTSILGILKERSPHPYIFNLNLWYVVFFSVIVGGVLYAFYFGPSNVTGPFLFALIKYMLVLLLIYNGISLLVRTEFWKSLTINLFILVISEFSLSIALVIAWYLVYIFTFISGIGFLIAIPEPASGFYLLIYISSFILIYFTVAFYILSSSVKPILIFTANNWIKGDQNPNLKLKISGGKILSICWISKVGVCVKEQNSLVLIPWKSYKTIEIIYELGKQNTKRK